MTTAIPEVSRPSPLKLYSLQEVLDLPPIEWLIDGVIPSGGQVVLFGPSGEGKSFVALDMAFSVATGRPWHGHAVKRHPVIYVVAEGGHGTGQRLVAWMREHDVEQEDGIFFVINAVQLTKEESITDLLQQIVAVNTRPALIVIDTLARCFGVDDVPPLSVAVRFRVRQ